MKTLDEVIEDFVAVRCEASYQELKGTKEFQKAYPNYERLFDSLLEATISEGNKKLFDKYHSAEGEVSCLQIYSAYKMGIKDALLMLSKLNLV